MDVPELWESKVEEHEFFLRDSLIIGKDEDLLELLMVIDMRHYAEV